jgi:N-acyl-D-aspartate/D-glutamate deacylase
MKTPFRSFAFLSAGLAAAVTAQAREFDVIIRGGTVVDGTGASRRKADVAIIGDTIVGVGNLAGSTAKREINASGLIVAPGFVDLHAHLDGTDGLRSDDPKKRAAQNFVMQGITTGAVNPDGRQPTPDLREERRAMEAGGIGVNVALFNGHNTIRAMVMAKDQERPAKPEEVKAMQAILEKGLKEEGSFGLSLGLEYYSSQYSKTEEVIDLAKTLAPYGGIWIAHQRSQGISPMWYKPSENKLPPPTLQDALLESMRVAEETGVTTVITHMKGWGPGYRGQAAKFVAQLQAARDRGARIFIDLYAFNSAGSDGAFVMIPPWAYGGKGANIPQQNAMGASYRDALRKTLENPAKGADLEKDVENQVALKGGAENVVVLEYKDPTYVGKTVADLMKMRKMSATELAVAMQLEGDEHKPGGVWLRALSLDEHDLEIYYAQPWAAMGTDGSIVLPEEAVGARKYLGTNRRFFGTYPNRLGYFTRERQVDTLEEAIRKCSALGAEILNIPDRGKLLPGMKADIVVFDYSALKDNTSVAEPSVYPTGVQYTFVNGVTAVDGGKRTLSRVGRVLDPVGRPAK